MKFTLKAEQEHYHDIVVTSSFKAEDLETVLDQVKTFLLGAGYVFDPCSRLDIVNDE